MKLLKTKIVLLVIGFLLVHTITYSQVPVPMAPPPPVGLPIDNGIVGLLFVGLFYGIYKIKKIIKC